MSSRDPGSRPEARTCVTCGGPLGESSSYCHRCGEKRLEPEDLGLGRYLGSFLRTLTDIDGRLWRTLGHLLLRPGRLALEWERGRRKVHLSPAQLFLLANAVYFFVQPVTGFGGYSTTLELQMDRQLYSNVVDVRERVERRVQERGWTFERYRRSFDRTSRVLARTMVFAMIPMFALALWASFPGRRRRPFTVHLVQATHFYAWDLLFMGSLFLLFWAYGGSAIFGAPLRLLDPGSFLHGFFSALWREAPTAPFLLFFFYAAPRRTYRASLLGATVRLPLLLGVYFATILVYRLLLFEVTFLLV